MTDRLYTTADAARELKVSVPLVKKIRAAMSIGRKVGRDWLFTSADLEAMRRRNTRIGRPPRTP